MLAEQKRWNSSNSSIRVVVVVAAEVAEDFSLCHVVVTNFPLLDGVKFPVFSLFFLVHRCLSEKMLLGLNMLLSQVSYICMWYNPSTIFGGVCVILSVTQYLQNVTQIPPG
jgi:hypothetical protein